jgi:hypothetical protein
MAWLSENEVRESAMATRRRPFFQFTITKSHHPSPIVFSWSFFDRTNHGISMR